MTQPLVEPLSERELDVLHHLAEHKTNQEIARALFISVNTVKTHLKNIYGKLGVHDRREAVVKARKLDLLP
jgi:LuxR family maltose regulon positive regulatory protein